MITVAAPPPDDSQQPRPRTPRSTLSVAPPPAAHSTLRVAPPPVQAPPAAAPVRSPLRSSGQEYQEGQRNLRDTFAPHEAPTQTISNVVTGAVRTFAPELGQGADALLGSSAGTHATNALNKVGTVASAFPDLLGAISRDQDAPPAGATPIERLKNSNVAHALRMMGNDIAHLHNMQDVQDEYYLTGAHNLQALAARGDKTAAFFQAHPWFNAAATFAGELLDPVNYTPAGIAKLWSRAHGLQNGYTALRTRATTFAAAHPLVQKGVNAAQEVVGSGARHIDAAVPDAAQAQAHAARRQIMAARQAAAARARRLTSLVFKDAAPQEIEPALMAAQRRSKQAWLHQQTISRPDLVQRASRFLDEYAQARGAGHVQPSTPLVWEKYVGHPSVFDLGEGNAFTHASLADLQPEEQAHVMKIAQELELSREGPAMSDLTPAAAAVANRFRGVMGHTTGITRTMRPDILKSGEQIGHIPSRNIYFADEALGRGRGMAGVGEPIDEAKLLTLHRRQAIWAHDQHLPADDPDRVLSAAPYSALTPQQATENFLARRYDNLLQGQAQQAFEHVPSVHGKPGQAVPLVHEPQLPAVNTSVNGMTASVIPQDRHAYLQLVQAERELRAVQNLARRKGISEDEARTLLDTQTPRAGVASGRAREAKQAANKLTRTTGTAETQIGKGLAQTDAIGPQQVAHQIQTEDDLTRSAQQGAREQGAIGAHFDRKAGDFKTRSMNAAKRIIDKFVPAVKSARALGEQISARPGSRERLDASRTSFAQAQERFAQALESFTSAGRMDPQEYRKAVGGIAQQLEAEIRMAQEPYWSALEEQGGKIIPDQKWDPALRRYVDAGEFADLPKRLRGSPKALKGDASAEFRYGNLDQIADLIRERTGRDLSTSDVLDWFTSARKPQRGEVYAEARKQIADMLGTQERDAQAELVQARGERNTARGVHRENLQAKKAMPPGDIATTRGARALVGKTEKFGANLAKGLAARHGKTVESYDVLRKDLDKAQSASARVGQRAIDTVSDANLRSSKALQRGLSGVHARLEQTRQILDRAAQNATDRARIANLQKQFAQATASQKLALQQAYKRILAETPAHWPKPTYDPQFWTPLEGVTVHGRPLKWLDPEGKLIHRQLVKQLEYDAPPDAPIDDVAEALSSLHYAARAGMITNPGIHPIGNQGMLYALLTNDWAGFADHAATVLTALDPVKSIKVLHEGSPLLNAIPNAAVHGAQATLGKLADFGWKRVAAQMHEFAGEIQIARAHHVYDETTPMGYDMPDRETRAMFDDQGKVRGYETPVDKEHQPAYLENVPPGYLSTPAKVRRMYREFAKWNNKVVWETSEPLLAARFIRHFMRTGMSEAQAADAAREWLGSDKLTNFWRFRSGLLFPRWTRTVLWASMHLGLTKPGTWNAPLQSSRVQREGVGAGDIPTGAGPFALAFPNGTDAASGEKQFSFFEPHNPLGSTENMFAGAAFGDPRYGGALGHAIPPAAWAAYRLLPELRALWGVPASIGTVAGGRYVPGSFVGPHAKSSAEVLREGLGGMSSSLFMPLEQGSQALQNPFSLPASLTGSNLYEKHAGFSYPEGP